MIAIQPRKTILKLEYNDTDISGDISGDVESFTYNDRGADSSDSISIKVNAVDDKWINSWLPDKEAVLHPTLCTKNWIVQGDSTPLDCGTLEIPKEQASFRRAWQKRWRNFRSGSVPLVGTLTRWS